MPMTMLTDRFCRTARPQNGDRQTEYFDEVTKGLCLRASAGGARVFFAHYTRRKDRKRARIKLGPYGDITLAEARQKARDVRSAVGEGGDPADDRRIDRGALRVRDMVQAYIDYVAGQRSGREIARRLRKNVAEEIGAIPIAKLHRRDLTRCIDAVKNRGAKIEANRVFEDIRAMVRWARGRGDLDENLTEGMRPPADVVVRDRVLSRDEIRQFWTRLEDAKMQEGTRRVLRLCLVTAARVGEVSGMSSSELDLEHNTWTIPANRSKNGRQHVLPLSGLAVDLIKAQLAEVRQAAAKRESRLQRHIDHLVKGPALSAA
jgi:integrase